MQKMLKIFYLCEHLNIGGAEQLLLTTLKYLDRDKFSPIVYCIGEKGKIGEEIESIGISVRSLNKCISFWNNIAILYNLCCALRHEKPDILHTNLYFANIYGRIAAKLTGVNIVVTTLHNPDYTYEDNGRLSFKLRKALDKYTGRLYNRAFIAVSHSLKRDFQRHLGFKNVKVLYNCIETAQFINVDESAVKNKRYELGISDDEIAILNIGRLHPQKGQLHLIKAFNLIHRKDKRFKLFISGRGAIEDELRNKINDFGLNGSVTLLKDRRDIPEVFKACNIFAFPSLYEGFGIVLVEAMASGVPIVASDIEGVNEIVRDNIDALLVPKANPEELANALLCLAQDNARRAYLAENAKKRALEVFDVIPYIKNLQDFYQGLFKGSLK
jgi:glycosyltransferase involved in cell wall biosynthesis